MAETSPPPPPAHVYWLRELVVPALMLGSIGLFVYDCRDLSMVALLLPAGLIVVVLASLAWALAAAFLGRPGAAAGIVSAERDAASQDEDDAPGPILGRKAWSLVALPALLFLLLDYLGAFAALVALVFGAQLIFSAKSPVKSLLIAIAVTAPTYALFKYFLYARFPAGMLGIG